ncbi:MAG: nucleotidyl transferase AbiEii/AbiGii toxin family protein [Gammaproteobacteria bacterium]|nr:nucleotidyl transferase AbiEii/AbiGii toxin family protein [Gammaproteobacteria bacterium]MDE0270551.1 nucleotidyl transferase AbiEii/AbiGii toxin family protein [Gammaproteobacteria bacterium]
MRDFIGIAEMIVSSQPKLKGCLPAIEKELLHFEILHAMHDAGHLRKLTFKGGTCLRLCHGGQRLSEDLDFSGGASFQPGFLRNIEEVLRTRIGQVYGLEVTVAPPRLADGKGRTASRWVARVVTRPASRRAQLGVQRIKIEIDGHDPQPDVAPLPIRHPHGILIGDSPPFPVRATSMADICSDKMIAYPMSVLTRSNPRHRDAWDMAWLASRLGNTPSLAERAASKASTWGLDSELQEALRITAERSAELIESEGFRTTMGRFLPLDLAERTLHDPECRQMLALTVSEFCNATLKALDDRLPSPPAP